ncbi:MgtC/SapB family protein [Ensifer sp. BR816]|uniref:MgtC/SapB family protein n=1 Tax=Rhizobium sp. (strain BR816) TaxID=1057002 RepID=UPI00036D1B6C|nr:MgtC/SapB family protein [Ensifer sp. BR816]
MDLVEVFQRLGVAFSIGLLVGCERGWQERDERSGGRTAGIRTFGLAGFLGGLAGYLQTLSGPIAPAVLLLLFGGAFILFRMREAKEEEDFGVTTVVAALVVFALGATAVLGDVRVAAAGSVATTALLAAKRSLHTFLRQLTWLELRAALVLLAMTLVALPLLPNETIDPWDVLNPFELWLLTITIAAISFVGYVAIRVAGPRRGILFAGAAGGLVSSTALTLTFARFASEAPESARRLASGAAIAGALSLIRVLVIGGAMAPVLLTPLAIALVPAVLVLVAASVLVIRRGGKQSAPDLHLDNPFELGEVLRFGALLGAVIVASKVLVDKLGQRMLFAVAAISGLMDLDAITLSTARLTGPTVDLTTAVAAILIAVVVNLLTKVVLAFTAGGNGPYAVTLAVATVVAIAAGALAYFILGFVMPAPLVPA